MRTDSCVLPVTYADSAAANVSATGQVEPSTLIAGHGYVSM